MFKRPPYNSNCGKWGLCRKRIEKEAHRRGAKKTIYVKVGEENDGGESYKEKDQLAVHTYRATEEKKERIW